MISHFLNIPLIATCLALASCATTDKTDASLSSGAEEAGKKTQSSSSATKETLVIKESPSKVSGTARFVTTTLVNDGNIEGNVPSSVLSDAIPALEELLRKDPNNAQLATTYIGLLRMYNQNHSLQESTMNRSGAAGAQNAWFLLEAAYSAMARKDFSMADYLLGRAQKVAKDNPVARVAIQHATGVRLYLDDKPQAGLYEIKKAATGGTPFLPSLLTIGYSALRTGDYKTAEQMFSNAANLAPNSIAVRLGSAAAMRVQGRAGDAIPLLATLSRSHPSDKRIIWNYALALSEGDAAQQKQALDVLSKTLQLPGAPELDTRIQTLLTKLQTTASAQEKPAAATQPQTGSSGSAAAPATAKPAAAGAK
jgi:predicted Zn-dependent protease